MKSELVRVELLPLGKVLRVRRGTSLQDLLFAHGVEFPCGGRGICRGCKIRILDGEALVTTEEQEKLTAAELADGWRLACRGRVEGDLRIELEQWEAPILTDESPFAFTPQPGLGIAIDVGTTTLVGQLISLRTGQVLAVQTALNAQARHGADIMSRVEYAVAGKGQQVLQGLIREQVGGLILELLDTARQGPNQVGARTVLSAAAWDARKPAESSNAQQPANAAADRTVRAPGAPDEPTQAPSEGPLTAIVLVGNTVMHHLFCGVSLEPLSHYPFEPASPGLQTFQAAALGWRLPDNPVVRFLPCLGGFVGSDILAGVLATRLHESESLTALLDLGTNGEIVLGNRERLLCASTAAGPAFEGARISMGMRAATGAISEVHAEVGALRCHVLGNRAARGICGSGLVDATAAGLDLGWILPSGRLAKGDSLPLTGSVSLTPWDIRELQLAKGAIAAGLRLLLEHWGATAEQVSRLYLAGAFGNYINYASARRIGLLDFPVEKVRAAGNTALLGAKLALFGLTQHGGAYPEVLGKVKHVSLNEDPHFQEVYVEEMGFPPDKLG